MPNGKPTDLDYARRRFNAAMEKYNNKKRYRWFGTVVATANVSLQLVLLWMLKDVALSLPGEAAAVVAAWIFTDFLNGLVHLYMDANDGYDSLAGPLIANFHLHHKTPVYTPRCLPVVYFVETGSKVWLAGYLSAVALLAVFDLVSPWLLHVLVFTGVLSSVAEVSHYLCHTSSSPVAKVLGESRILLSKRHHAAHHLEDNVSYAFLNGLTDPWINVLAAKVSPGYKHHTDLHYADYETTGDSR